MKINYNHIKLFSIQNQSLKDSTNYESDIYVKKNTKLYEFLLKKFPEGFKEAKQVFINGKEIKVENFDIKLKENDLVSVAELPNYEIIFMILINVTIALVMQALFKPKKPYQSKQNSVYSTKQNQIMATLGDSVQVQYGRFRHYPRLIAEPYTFYHNNLQYHLAHTCAGQGDFNINKVYLNDTPINNLVDNSQVQYYFAQGSQSKTSYNEQFKSINSGLSKYLAFTAHKPTELENVSLSPLESGDSERRIGYTILNANNSKINKILASFEFPNGIFGVDEENSDIALDFNIIIGLREIDENDNDLPYFVERYFSETHNRRTPLRKTIVIDIKPGRYKVLIRRTDSKGDKNNNKDCSLVNVVGLEDNAHLEKTNKMSICSFLVKVGSGFSSNSGLKVNLDLTRKNEVIYGKTVSFNTLYDLVKDLWTNPNYGMKNKDLSYLDIREELNEPVNVVFDKKDNAFDQLSSVLKSFGYIIYPYLSHYVIRKEEKIDYRAAIFSSKNTKSISKSIKIQDNKEKVEGVSGKFIPFGELNTETINYPSGMDSYDDTLLLGISDYDTAYDSLVRFYNKKVKQAKTCNIKTDMEGFIPEIGSRIGVSSEYINENISMFGESCINGEVIMTQKYNFKANTTYYFVFDTINNDFYNVMEIIPFTVDTFTDTFIIKDNYMSIDSDVQFIVHIGDKEEVIEDFIITDIKPGEMNDNLNQPLEINIICKEYVESIY